MRFLCKTGWVLFLFPLMAFGATRYVSTTGTSVAPYNSWATAATNIQDAINASTDYDDTVLINDGTYYVQTAITNLFFIDMYIESVNGAEKTILDGQGVSSCIAVNSWDPNFRITGLTLRNGYAADGGGLRLFPNTTAQECIIEGNQAMTNGGGVFFDGGGTLRNCLILDNDAGDSGGGVGIHTGGTLENCTIVNNSATGDGGGLYTDTDGTAINCIIWSNTAVSVGDNWQGGSGTLSFTASCTSPQPTGSGNTNAEPRFLSTDYENYRLAPDSPCIDTGVNQGWMVDDLDGNLRVIRGTVDMGAYEAPLRSVHYVSPTGLSISPYLTWQTAATNIQDAVDSTSGDHTVQVDAGTYRLTETLMATNGVWILSENGAEETTIDAESLCGCLRISEGSLIQGFTLRNGNAGSGGGVFFDQGGTGQYCRVTANQSLSGGGGVFFNEGGLMQNCLISDNTSDGVGGGLGFYLGGSLENCTVANNTATGTGGGIYSYVGSSVVNSIIWSNTSSTAGDNWFHHAGAMPFTFSCTTPDPGGSSNLTNEAPLFVDAVGGNYQLFPNSPCVDAGTLLPWSAGAVDLLGNPRVAGGAVDMGAVEPPLSPTHYVSTTGSVLFPYTTWETATRNIQDAIDVASSGDTVKVDDGTYFVTESIIATNGIAVLSENGADLTVIDGQGLCGCVMLGGTAWMQGFTLRNGNASMGGGILFSQGGIVSDCILTSNQAVNGGGGGFFNEGGLMQNCLIADNTSADAGGGLGFYLGGSLENCTVANNTATGNGGGIYSYAGDAVVNSIIWSNTSSTAGDNWFHAAGAMSFTYSCTTPDPGGSNNLTNEPPDFVDVVAGDYHLLDASPCINAGTLLGWSSGGADLDGNPRVDASAVDLGAYELMTPIHYVSLSGASIFPYQTWATAATNIQDAVNAAEAGNSVQLAEGTYSPGAQISVSKAITLESVGSATIIHGQSAHRIFYLANASCTLRGLTIYNGAATGTSASDPNGYGGGVYCTGTNPVIENCVISENAAWDGGGLYGGRAYGCSIRGNSSYVNGGGAYGGLLFSCTIEGNVSTFGDGAGAYGGEIRNSEVTGNVSGRNGGGVASAEALHCTILQNTAQTSYSGGGIYEGTATNCIVWSNTIGGVANNIASAGVGYTCSPDIPHGSNGNTTNDPQIVHIANDLRLLLSSPCIDTALAIGETDDVAGTPRPLDGNADGSASPDMGCYEALCFWADSDGDGLSDRDEFDLYGSNPTLTDSDGDGRSDSNEVAMGYSPTYDEAPAIATGVAQGETSVTSSPASYGLYTADSISDLDMGYLMVQATGGMLRIDCQIQQCTNLVEDLWTPAGSLLQWDMPITSNKFFYRVRGSD